MIFRQVVHDDLGCASYFIGDEQEGRAAVVDPRFEIDEYLELARYLGVRVTDIFETHNHADHVSGHGRLAAATGATIHIHSLVAAEFTHEPFEHGDAASRVEQGGHRRFGSPIGRGWPTCAGWPSCPGWPGRSGWPTHLG